MMDSKISMIDKLTIFNIMKLTIFLFQKKTDIKKKRRLLWQNMHLDWTTEHYL